MLNRPNLKYYFLNAYIHIGDEKSAQKTVITYHLMHPESRKRTQDDSFYLMGTQLTAIDDETVDELIHHIQSIYEKSHYLIDFDKMNEDVNIILKNAITQQRTYSAAFK